LIAHFFVLLVGRAGIEPATHGLHTTLAFTSRQKFWRCSLDYLITHSRNCLGVRRIVSEGFLEKERQHLAGKMPSWKTAFHFKSCLLIVQSSKFSRWIPYLKLSGFPSIQPHFHFIVSNERSYFNEQESVALPTELTTQINEMDYNNKEI